MKRILLLTAVSAFATLPAFAADLGVIEAPVPDNYMEPAFSWTGLYVGINGGGAFGDVEPGNSDSFDI